MADRLLEGYKVLEVGHYVAAPYCGKLMAGYGAEVIKVETPGVGDGARHEGPFFRDIPDPETSALYLWLNTNKKGITLNLKTEAGRKIFLDLVKDADVVLENFEPRVMPALGLGYDDLAKVNPNIIMTSISNFGQTGPFRDHKGTELTMQAMGGLTYMNGEPDREPVPIAGNQAQYHGGINAFTATLTALMYREFGGEGQQVDISILECVNSIMEQHDAKWEYEKGITGRYGPTVGGRAAWGLYPCSDGFASIVSGPERRWAKVAELMEEPMLGNPDYVGTGRITYKEEIEAMMMPWLMTHTKEEIYHKGQAAGLPFGIVCDFGDLLSSPQLLARKFFVEIDHPKTGPLMYPGAPVNPAGAPWVAGRAPLLGEHNEEILGKRLGFSKDDLIRLRGQGVI